MVDGDLDAAPIDFGLGDFNLDLTAFDLNAAPNANRYILPKPSRHVRQYAVNYDRAADLVKDCGQDILDGARVDAMLSGNFIFGDFFEALAVECMAKIDSLTLSTLSFGQENVDSLANMMRTGFLGSLGIIVSDYFWAHNRRDAKYIYEALDIDDRFQLAVAGTHTKIAMLDIGGRKIVAHGSANLRSSRSVETVTIETNAELYDFHMAWHQEILDRYATIQKPMRAQKLFDHLTKKG